ncbi:unnamed protein product [Agarophyton chilense]
MMFLALCCVPLAMALLAAARATCPVNAVCFALDQSGSIDDAEYATQQRFVIAVARQLASRTNDTQYSAYAFSSSALVIQAATPRLEADFVPTVLGTARSRGGTSVYSGLDACFREVRPTAGNRVVVLITDGEDTGFPLASELAPDVKSAAVSIVTVGVGDAVNGEYLRALATAPDFFVDSSFDALPSDVVRVAESSCDVVQVTPDPVPPTVAPVTPTPPPPQPPTACQQAYDRCPFAFARIASVPLFAIDTPPDAPFTPAIVSRDARQRLGILNTNGIVPELIADDGAVTALTSLSAAQPFSISQFKPFPVPNATFSAVGHETFHADQLAMVRNRCVRLFFSQLQLLNVTPPFDVVENVAAMRSDGQCVVFRTI